MFDRTMVAICSVIAVVCVCILGYTFIHATILAHEGRWFVVAIMTLSSWVLVIAGIDKLEKWSKA
jgi:hypothetical protein